MSTDNIEARLCSYSMLVNEVTYLVGWNAVLRLLQLGTSAAAVSAFSPLSRAWTVSGDNRWSREALKGRAAEKVDERQFLALGQMRDWYEQLDDRGLRATGSRQQERYLDVLHDRMERVGIQHVRVMRY